jgi:hypothetical protein
VLQILTSAWTASAVAVITSAACNKLSLRHSGAAAADLYGTAATKRSGESQHPSVASQASRVESAWRSDCSGLCAAHTARCAASSLMLLDALTLPRERDLAEQTCRPSRCRSPYCRARRLRRLLVLRARARTHARAPEPMQAALVAAVCRQTTVLTLTIHPYHLSQPSLQPATGCRPHNLRSGRVLGAGACGRRRDCASTERYTRFMAVVCSESSSSVVCVSLSAVSDRYKSDRRSGCLHVAKCFDV